MYNMKAYKYLPIFFLFIFSAEMPVTSAGCDLQLKEKKSPTENAKNEKSDDGSKTAADDKSVAYKTVGSDSATTKRNYKEGEIVTPEMYGAIGDGVIRKLSTKYNSLQQAKKDYPNVLDLDVSIDGAAFQKAVDEVNAKGGGTVSAKKNYAINFPIEAKDNVIIDGGESGRIYNDQSRKVTIHQCAFFVGDHHAAGFTPNGVNAKYKLYDVAGKIKAGQNNAKLTNTSDASNFRTGQLIILCTVSKKNSVRENAMLPYHITVCKITNISNGILTFEYPIDEDISDPQIAANGSFDNYSLISLTGVQNVTIRNFTIDARSWAVRWFGYKCTIENLTLVNASELIVGNALAHSTIKNIKGDFSRRCIEVKTGSHDLVIDGINAVYKGRPDPKESRSVISIGEYNRSITIRNFDIDMGNLAIQDPVIGLHSRKAVIENGTISCKNQSGVVIKLFSDDFSPAEQYACFGNKISNVKFYCNQNIKSFVLVGTPTTTEVQPASNTIEDCSFSGGSAQTTVNLNGGNKNIIRKCDFAKARMVKNRSFNASNTLEANKF